MGDHPPTSAHLHTRAHPRIHAHTHPQTLRWLLGPPTHESAHPQRRHPRSVVNDTLGISTAGIHVCVCVGGVGVGVAYPMHHPATPPHPRPTSTPRPIHPHPTHSPEHNEHILSAPPSHAHVYTTAPALTPTHINAPPLLAMTTPSRHNHTYPSPTHIHCRCHRITFYVFPQRRGRRYIPCLALAFRRRGRAGSPAARRSRPQRRPPLCRRLQPPPRTGVERGAMLAARARASRASTSRCSR